MSLNSLQSRLIPVGAEPSVTEQSDSFGQVSLAIPKAAWGLEPRCLSVEAASLRQAGEFQTLAGQKVNCRPFCSYHLCQAKYSDSSIYGPEKPIIFCGTGTEANTIFDLAATHFFEAGYDVFVSQLRGFGESSAALTKIRDADVLAFEREKLLSLASFYAELTGRNRLSVYFVASSYSCAMACRLACDSTLIKRGIEIVGAHLIGPPFAHQHPVLDWMLKSRALPVLAPVIRHLAVGSSSSEWYENQLQAERNRSGFVEHSRVGRHLVYPSFPNCYLSEFSMGCRAAMDCAPRVKMPVVLVEGRHDVLVGQIPSHVRAAFENERSLLLPNSGHEMLLDHDAEFLISDILSSVSR